MTGQNAPEGPRIDPLAVEALERLVPRARQLLIIGVTLIVLGTAALTIMATASVVSIVPVGLVIIVGALMEMGVGHHARAPDGPLSPWMKSGAPAGLRGPVRRHGPAPAVDHVQHPRRAGPHGGRLGAPAGDLLHAPASEERHRAGLRLGLHPHRLLLVTRWPGDNMVVAGNLLALELVVTGWGLVGAGTDAFAPRPQLKLYCNMLN